MSCPTGNCKFAPYQTLGFCSRCAHVTVSLQVSTEGSSTMTNYHYNLQNGLQLNTEYSMPYIMNSTTGFNLLKLDMDSAAVILSFTAISSAGSRIPPEHSATECSLFFCVNTYKALVREGVFSENRISTDISSNTTLSDMGATKDFLLTPETCYFNGTRYDQPQQQSRKCTYNVNWLSRQIR